MASFYRWSPIGRSLLLLIIAAVLLSACATGGTAVQVSPTRAAAFQTSVKTTDGQFVIQLSVTPNRLGLNVFTVEVQNTQSGKPMPNLQVRLTTTMLDMNMGTDLIDLLPDGQGQYRAQGTLSMGGHWEIRLLLRTPDTTLHQASVKLDTSA
jgi:copper transport protein